MPSMVVFVPWNATQILSERGVPLMESAVATSDRQVRPSKRDLAESRSMQLLQAAIILSEDAGVERIAASAMSHLMRHAAAGGQVESAIRSANLAESRVEAMAGTEVGVNVLDAVGGMVVEDMDDAEAERLRSAGFQVFPNELLFFAPPLEEAEEDIEVEWHLRKCGAVRMHERGLTGAGATIGILDTGIDPEHPEFQGKRIHFAEFDMMGRLVGSNARDTGDHGTHVAAIAAGRTVGVARDADLAVAAVLTYPGPNGNSGYLGQIAAGFNWLAGNYVNGLEAPEDVTVINASLGSTGYRDYLYGPVAEARAIGIPFVGSIGNAGRNGRNRHGSPGNYDIAIGVGASDEQDNMGEFSDWGTVSQHGNRDKPDLSAPGVAVNSALPGGGYGRKSGTSMAAPCVAGAIALLIEENPAFGNDVAALEQELYDRRVVPISGQRQDRQGRGRLEL